MTLARNTELGSITISNTIFAQIIFDGMTLPQCNNMIWPATKRGRQIAIGSRFNDTDFAMNIDSDYDDNGNMVIEFNVIVRFGISIKRITKHLADYVADEIEYDSGKKPSVIIINIAGVRSRHKAKRNTKVVYRYDAE